MRNPNEADVGSTEKMTTKEGTSWMNPGKFPPFTPGTKSEKSADNIDDAPVSKEAQIEAIKSANQNAENTLVAEYVQSSLFDKLGKKNLDITAIVPVQEQLCSIPEQSRELFLSVVNTFDRDDNWKPHFQAVLNNFTNGKFDDLIQSISSSGLEELDLAAFDRIITHKGNYLNITTADELNNIEGIIDSRIDEAAQNGDDEQWKNFTLLKKYNLSLDEAKILTQKYSYKIEDVETDRYASTKSFLTELKSIVSAETPEEFGRLLDAADDIPMQNYPDFQIEAQKMYTEAFNRELFNPKGSEYYLEDGVRIIDAGTDFKMLVRSEGAFSGKKQDGNYAANWNRPLRINTSFSTSPISSNHLLYYGMTQYSEEEPSVTYGFADLDDNAVIENALGDDATVHRRKYTLDTSSYKDFQNISPTTFDGCGQRFMSIDDIMDDSSRGIHAETVLSRFYLDEEGNEHRRQPSYIVYVKTGEDYHEDPMYEESKKTARDFDIPVVMIDMRKVLNENRQKVEQRKAELEQDWSIDGVVDVVQTWANNSLLQLRSGASELVDEFFPEEIDGENVMANFILTQMEKAPDSQRQQLYDKLMVLNAKKNIVPETFMVRLQRSHPDLSAKLDEYAKELFGVTVGDQSTDSIWHSYSRIDECYDICEECGISTANDELLKRPPSDLRKTIELCTEIGIAPSEELALLNSYDLKETIDLCQANDIQPDTDLLLQKPHILRQKIMACKNGGIQLSADILKKTEEEIDAIAKENKAAQPTNNADSFDGFDDFPSDDWGNNSWDDWV